MIAMIAAIRIAEKKFSDRSDHMETTLLLAIVATAKIH